MLFISKGLGTKIQTNSIKNLALFFFLQLSSLGADFFFQRFADVDYLFLESHSNLTICIFRVSN